MSSKNEYITIMIACSISSMSSATFLFYFLRCEALRQKVSMNLIAIFQLFDMILCLNKLIPIYLMGSTEWICRFLGSLEQFFTVSELIWISWFSLFVYRTICLGKYQNQAINLKKALIVTFSVSFMISILLGTLDLYKKADYWCWIDVNIGIKEFFLQEFLTSYIFFFISCGLGCFVSWKVFKLYKLRKMNNRSIEWHVLRLQVYPLIIFFAYIFMFISRLCRALGYETSWGYERFASFLINLIGFINFVVLGLNQEFRSALRFKIGESTPLDVSMA